MADKKTLIVLAGGLGTRLRPIVADKPKPLAEISHKPFLEFVLRHWVNEGVKDFIFLLHYEADQIINFLKSIETSVLHECTYSTVIETELLGTGGAVAHAINKLNIQHSFALINADTWHGVGLAEIWSTSDPVVAITEVEDVSRYGAIEVNETGCATKFIEKERCGGSGWINAGLYLLHPSIFDEWKGRKFSLEQDLLPNLAAEKSLNTFLLEGPFIDIGIPEDYHRFVDWVASGNIV